MNTADRIAFGAMFFVASYFLGATWGKLAVAAIVEVLL